MSEDALPPPAGGRWRALGDRGFGERPTMADLAGEGLRERKKRLMRRLISDTATTMFLEHGFDEVRVAEVAAACGVSEKTVYNYFPTKESLILDREEAMTESLRRVLGPGGDRGSPIEAAVGLITEELRELCGSRDGDADGSLDLGVLRRFGDLVEHTPSLRAAQRDMMDRLVEVAAQAMAMRAGMDPDDPEPQIAADAILGLWRVQFRAMKRHAESGRPAAEMREQVVSEVRRAARLIDTGLWSFGMAVQGANGRDQLRAAAESANAARRQVVLAIQQAREAWRLVAEAHRAEEGQVHPGRPGPDRRELRKLAHDKERTVRGSRHPRHR